MRETYNRLWTEVRSGRHKLVVAIANSIHEKAPCGLLFKEPVTHWHIIVWFNHAKPTDTSFHRSLLIELDKKGRHWSGEMIRVQDSMTKYIQCEPRALVTLYGNPAWKSYVDEHWFLRHAMKKNIEVRDERAKGVKRKFHESDWYEEQGMNPQKLCDEIVAWGCRDVASYLMYMKKEKPERSYGSFIYHPRRDVIERQINGKH